MSSISEALGNDPFMPRMVKSVKNAEMIIREIIDLHQECADLNAQLGKYYEAGDAMKRARLYESELRTIRHFRLRVV